MALDLVLFFFLSEEKEKSDVPSLLSQQSLKLGSVFLLFSFGRLGFLDIDSYGFVISSHVYGGRGHGHFAFGLCLRHLPPGISLRRGKWDKNQR